MLIPNNNFLFARTQETSFLETLKIHSILWCAAEAHRRGEEMQLDSQSWTDLILAAVDTQTRRDVLTHAALETVTRFHGVSFFFSPNIKKSHIKQTEQN